MSVVRGGGSFARAAVSALVLILLGACGNGGGGSSAGVFTIGFANDITGAGGSIVGPSFEHGFELAVNEYNATKPSTTIKYLMDDDQSTVQAATEIVTKFLIEDKVNVILGPVGTTQIPAVSPLVLQNKTPLISYNAVGLDNTSLNNPYIFNTAITTGLLGKAYPDFVVQKLGLKKIAFVTSDDASGQAYTKSVQAEISKLGAELVDVEALTPAVIDLTPTATKLKSKAPDAVIMTMFTPQAAPLIKASFQQGFKPVWVAGTQFNNQVEQTAGAAAEGMYAATPFNPAVATSGAPKDFLDAFRKEFGGDPDYFAVQSYEAALVVANALKNGGPSASGFLAALRATKDVPGPLGPISFDSTQNIVVGPGGVNIAWSKVTNGQRVPVTS